MKNAPLVTEGDRVRIVVEGEVTFVGSNPSYNWCEIGRGPNVTGIRASAEHVVSVEVLAKPFKVGDTVKRGDYANLPIGTVVKGEFPTSSALFKTAPNRWVDNGGAYSDASFYDDRTIKYLPDAS